MLALALLPAPALAVGSTPSPRPLAQELNAAQAQLAQLAASLDVADENYRQGQIALHQATLDQAAAERALAKGKARHAALQTRVDRIATFAYQTGASPDILVATPDGAAAFAESTALLSQVSSQQQSTLSAAAAAQYELAVAQTAAFQAADATARTTAQLAAAKAAIASQVAAHQAIVSSLVDRQHTLEAIAAEKARLAAIAEAKARAERDAAARKAAEAAAAAAVAAARQAAADAAQAKAAAQREVAQKAADRRQALAEAAAQTRQQQDTSSTSTSNGSSAGPPSSRASLAVRAAYRQLGAPYDWAADGPQSFDCSGLTAYAWAAAGVSLPHSSQAQYGVGAHVSRSQLSPGDLVFFGSPIHHVGIYVGGGQMIDAPQTGDVVRVQSIDRSDYTGAVRVTG
ncbi:hypothetical protein acdb102_14670 [Acidothermaceae bacterium B102]|nr:hypothetical protein acdb102_14670 [Acidothermaceae bacterium B102]